MPISTLPINKQILFRTSSATSVISQGGNIIVSGLTSVPKRNLINIIEVKYRAEVPQVVTIGSNSYTPVGATQYEISVFDPNRDVSGFNEPIKFYGYTTPDDITTLGATAALQREAIHVAIIAKVNADDSNHAVAATNAGGTGFTITDDGGYYPPHAQTMTNVLFVNTVLKTSGFIAAPTITTAGVTSSGVGATLSGQVAVTDWMNGGNLISGYPIYPKTLAGLPALSGQKYDAFVINSLMLAPIPESISGQQIAFVNSAQTIWIDNGTGSDTANLAGFKATERVLHKLMVQAYATDQKTVQEWFDKPIVFQDPLGAAPTGTADTLGWQLSPYGSLNRTNISTQTIVVPVLDATGLLIDQDDTATEGSHTSANQQTLGDQSFIVGQTSAIVGARYVMGDFTDAAFMVGFRKKAVYGAVINNYTDYATIGNGSSAAGTTWINGDFFVTRATINSGATLQTISAVAPADGVSVLAYLKVAIDGTVSAYVNGTSYPIYSAGTTQMVFDAGDEMIAFYQIVNIGSGDPACSIGEFFSVADDSLIQ